MLVSLCVIAYNEEKTIPKLFDDIRLQDYPHDRLEIVLVDDVSTDGTKAVMEAFAKEQNGFYRVVIEESPRNLQAAAWNTAILAANGDIIIRVDAHASIPENFVSANVKNMEEGEYVCGGGRPNRAEKETPWQMTLLALEESLFGSSIAKYRRQQKVKQEVSSVFHGAYRAEVFAKVGGFNEDLGRTEDNELHYRIRQAGYRIYSCPNIVSYQNVRATLAKMLRQKYGNGLWIGLTLGVCPGCLSYFHFAPLVLVCTLLIFGVLAACGVTLPLILLSAAYLFFDAIVTATAFSGRKAHLQFVLLPFLFPLLHIVYGVGTLFGVIKMPFWRKKLGTGAQQRINLVKEAVSAKLEKRQSGKRGYTIE